MVKPTGFREYDARWLFGEEINLMGVQALGIGLATLLDEMGTAPEVVVGHDFRSYSASIKYALIAGLMAGGATVHDIGLAITPMAYFAQFALDVARGGDGHRLAQRQRLDRRENGRAAPGHLRPRRDGPPARHRGRRPLPAGFGWSLSVRRGFPGPLYRRSHRPAQIDPPREGRRRLRQRHGGSLRADHPFGARLRGRSARLRSRLQLSPLQSRIPKI